MNSPTPKWYRHPYIIHLNIALYMVVSLYFGGEKVMFQMGNVLSFKEPGGTKTVLTTASCVRGNACPPPASPQPLWTPKSPARRVRDGTSKRTQRRQFRLGSICFYCLLLLFICLTIIVEQKNNKNKGGLSRNLQESCLNGEGRCVSRINSILVSTNTSRVVRIGCNWSGNI